MTYLSSRGSDEMRSYAVVLDGPRVISGPIYRDNRGDWRFTFSDKSVKDVASSDGVVKIVHY